MAGTSAEERAEKWGSKYNPEITRQRLRVARHRAKRNFYKGVRRIALIDSVTRDILDDFGIVACTRSNYYGFARKLHKRLYNNSMVFWSDLIEGCIKDFATSYRCEEEILRKISSEVDFATRFILTTEGRFIPTQAEIEVLKERGKKMIEKYPELLKLVEGESK
jgi:hypothetical protein